MRNYMFFGTLANFKFLIFNKKNYVWEFFYNVKRNIERVVISLKVLKDIYLEYKFNLVDNFYYFGNIPNTYIF